MANTKSALKRMRQSEIRRQRNRNIKTRVKNAVKKFYISLEEGNEENARQVFYETSKIIDKAVSKGLLHKRTAARKKSRLSRQLNKRVS
ncbi:MAG: 30S ribosomal protein S20 [Dethiobacteria bacterium]|jgi:small subunit ribosomal protein S20